MRVRLFAAALMCCCSTMLHAELVSYWPFEDFPDELSTPDVVSGHDMELLSDGFFDSENHVDGKFGKAFEFFGNEDASLFFYTQQDESDKLPINLQPEWTISMWANVEGTGQNDLRLFSESNTAGDNNPLFNIGTANNGADGSLDIYIRNNQLSTGTVNHPHTTAHPFNGEWNHIGWTYADGMHNVWVNGFLDSSYPMQSFGEIDPVNIDTTTIGGILRGGPSHHVTGIIDDVAVWDEVLPGGTIFGLATEQTTPLDALSYEGVLPPKSVGDAGAVGSVVLAGSQENNVFGPSESGVSGWSARIVTAEDHGGTLSTHTDAIFALEDFEGDSGGGVAYSVVDFGGGGGTFGQTQPYPNGVATTAQNDFVVEATANVTIPAGTWTLGVGSDDGGRILVDDDDFEFEELSDNADLNVDFNEVRFEGNRGHGWTVGTFTLDEPLETTIKASFHERGGGDSFEVAVLDDAAVENADPAGGWELLSDGTFGWSVKTEAAPLLSADVVGAVEAREGGWEIDVDPTDGSVDAFVLENPDETLFTTVVDVDGVEFHINPLGDVAEGSTFQIVVADTVTGTPSIMTEGWSFDAATGSVVFGSAGPICDPNTQGDLDGDGTVAFADFLILSNSFGQNVDGHAQGDIDCSGDVAFADFLILSNNFGNAVGAESVPEPMGVSLLAMGMLALGAMRRRRTLA